MEQGKKKQGGSREKLTADLHVCILNSSTWKGRGKVPVLFDSSMVALEPGQLIRISSLFCFTCVLHAQPSCASSPSLILHGIMHPITHGSDDVDLSRRTLVPSLRFGLLLLNIAARHSGCQHESEVRRSLQCQWSSSLPGGRKSGHRVFLMSLAAEPLAGYKEQLTSSQRFQCILACTDCWVSGNSYHSAKTHSQPHG